MEDEWRSRNLFVKNVDFSVDSELLRTIFRPYGFIHSAKVMKNVIDRSRGVGFVCFSTTAETETAQREVIGQCIYGRQIYVGFAQKRTG